MLQCRCLNENSVFLLLVTANLRQTRVLIATRGQILWCSPNGSLNVQCLLFFKTGKMILNAYCVLCEFPSTHIVFIFLCLSSFFSKNLEEEKNKKLQIPDIDIFCKICSLTHLLSTHTRNHCNFLRM